MSTFVITGCNRGIGLELCRQLRARGERVIGVCRQPADALAALGVETVTGIDVGSDAAMEPLVQGLDRILDGAPIDVLINNAGVLTRETLEDLDMGRIRAQFEVNTLGPLRVTCALLDRLGEGSKVGIVSSRVGSIGDNGSGGAYGYRMSKAAVNMAGVNLAHDLRDRGIAVAILHPGMVATDMTGGRGIQPAEAAAGLIERLDELTLAQTGGFWHANGERLPW